MKMTIEIPDPLFRRAKSKGAENGQTLKDFVTKAIRDKLAAKAGCSIPLEPAWMQGFGKLKRLARESRKMQARINGEFEVVEPEDRL